jgi:polyhydroxyalkanoate synthesis regulator phasin
VKLLEFEYSLTARFPASVKAALYASRTRGDDSASARASEVDVLTGEVERLLAETASLRAELEQERSSRRVESGEDLLPGLRAQVGEWMCAVYTLIDASGLSLAKYSSADLFLVLQVIAQRRLAEAAEAEVARLQSSVASLQEECRRWSSMLDSQVQLVGALAV